MGYQKKAKSNFGALLVDDSSIPKTPKQKIVPVKEEIELDLLQIKIPSSYKQQVKVYASMNRITITDLITTMLIEKNIIDPHK